MLCGAMTWLSMNWGSINCVSKSRNAALCYLRSGNMVLHCSNVCEAHKKVERMWFQYKRHRVESEVSLPEFFRYFVKVTGVRFYRAI